MKKTVLMLAAFAAFICACTQETIPAAQETIPAVQEYQEIILSASSGDAGTRSSRDTQGNFYWSPEDKINLFRGNSGGWELTSTNTEPAREAKFRGEIPAGSLPSSGKYWGVYPYNADNQCDGTTLTVVVPTSQVAAEGTFADGQFVSIGCSDDLSMTFYHLCGGVKFKLENPGITSVTLSGRNNEVLAGKVKVIMDEEGHPVVDQVVEGATSVTLACPDGFTPGKEYFFVTLPVRFSDGFTVSFGSGLSRTISTAMTVNRAKFQWSSSALDYKIDGFTYETCDIENAGTRSYLENVDYSDDPNYTKSSAKSYRSQATDDPQPVKIQWSGKASKVQVSTSPLFTSPVEYTISGSATSQNIYNLIPGEKYYYKVLNSSGTVLKQACVTPVGPLRMIYGFSYNVRDLGGWEADGGHIAYGKLYRGANIDNINTSGKTVFRDNLGINVQLDLRGYKSSEASAGPVFPANEVYYEQIHVRKFFDEGNGTSQKLYKQAIRSIIGWLAEGKVIYFHCAGGADRTGTLAFLIEALLGVSESDMSKEYELTSFDGSHERYRNMSVQAGDSYRLTDLVNYLRDGRFGNPATTTMNQLVWNWATTQPEPDDDPDYDVAPLTESEINLLRQYLIVQD